MLMVWFGNYKKAKLMAIILGSIAAAFLLVSAAFWALETYKINAYEHVVSIVTDFDTRDGNNVWTEFAYSLHGQDYTVRLKGHSYWMKPNSSVNLIVNPKIPNQAKVLHDSPFILSLILLIGGGFFAVFFLLYLLNARAIRKKERKTVAIP